jgi:hypothetical protein
VRREVERAVYREVLVLPFRVADVLPSRSLEYFLSSQHWLDAFPPPMEPHYARLCAHVKSLLAGGGAAAHPAQPAPQLTGVRTQNGAAAELSMAELQRLEAELAHYIGPVARHLVHRAARRTSGVDALILELGAEIESEADRRQFIKASRQSLRGAAG